MPRKITKKTKTKKGDVTQTVIVNVAKRGSSKPRTQPTQPSQTQLLLSLLAQRQPLIQQIQPQQQPLIQPIQPLQQQLEELHKRQTILGKQLNNVATFIANKPTETGKSYVLDQPDAPLVQPNQPAVSGSPIRLDDPHEDAPIPETPKKSIESILGPGVKIKKPKPAKEEEQEDEKYDTSNDTPQKKKLPFKVKKPIRAPDSV